MNKKKETKIKFIKKARNKEIILKIIYIFIIICITLNIIFLLNSTIKQIDYFNLLGISLFTMKSDLGGEKIPKNSLVVVKEYKNNENINLNDNIAYIVKR